MIVVEGPAEAGSAPAIFIGTRDSIDAHLQRRDTPPAGARRGPQAVLEWVVVGGVLAIGNAILWTLDYFFGAIEVQNLYWEMAEVPGCTTYDTLGRLLDARIQQRVGDLRLVLVFVGAAHPTTGASDVVAAWLTDEALDGSLDLVQELLNTHRALGFGNADASTRVRIEFDEATNGYDAQYVGYTIYPDDPCCSGRVPSRFTLEQGPFAARPGDTVHPSVRILNDFGEGVEGVLVNFWPADGSGSITLPGAASTDARGYAQAAWTLPSEIGTFSGFVSADGLGQHTYRAETVEAGEGTPTIDGVMGPSEWDGAYTKQVTVGLPGGAAAQATLFVMNDAVHSYWALAVPYPATRGTIRLFFDADPSVIDAPGTDWVYGGTVGAWNRFGVPVDDGGVGLYDGFTRDDGALPLDIGHQLADGYRLERLRGALDGKAGFGTSSAGAVWEVSRPHATGDPYDLAVNPGGGLPVRIQVGIGSSEGHEYSWLSVPHRIFFAPSSLTPNIPSDVWITYTGPAGASGVEVSVDGATVRGHGGPRTVFFRVGRGARKVRITGLFCHDGSAAHISRTIEALPGGSKALVFFASDYC